MIITNLQKTLSFNCCCFYYYYYSLTFYILFILISIIFRNFIVIIIIIDDIIFFTSLLKVACITLFFDYKDVFLRIKQNTISENGLLLKSVLQNVIQLIIIDYRQSTFTDSVPILKFPFRSFKTRVVQLNKFL